MPTWCKVIIGIVGGIITLKILANVVLLFAPSDY